MIDENKLKQALIRREVTTVMYDIVDREISYLPKEEVIPLDRIKQAREEIDDYKKRQLTMAIGVEDLEQGKQVALDYVITILDKLIAEVEGTNES